MGDLGGAGLGRPPRRAAISGAWAAAERAQSILALSSELLRALRGKRSQTAFSRRLGYRSNVVYGWESGHRWPSSSAFFAAARRTGVDLRAALARFFPSEPPWLTASDLASRQGVTRLLEELRGNRKLRPLARQMGVSRVTLAGWLRAKAEPRLPELLAMIEATSLSSAEHAWADLGRSAASRTSCPSATQGRLDQIC